MHMLSSYNLQVPNDHNLGKNQWARMKPASLPSLEPIHDLDTERKLVGP